MSVDEIFPDRAQVLSPEEEEIMSGLDEQMEKCCSQLDLDALHGASDLLRRETDSLKCARSIIEAQQRAVFLQRLSSIVVDACSKIEAKMHVRT